MKTFNYDKHDSPFKYEITFLEKGERKGWCEKQDGTWRYMSFDQGAVIVERSPAGYNWSEYNYPSEAVERILTNLAAKGYTKTKA